MQRWRSKLGAVLLALLALPAFGQQFVAPYVTLQGTLSNSSGIPAQNATLTFQLNQAGFVAGTATIVTSSQCSTDVSGAVVGVGNPQTGPRVSVQYTGTLPAANYYVEYTWYDQFGNQTLASPEVRMQLSAVGELQILPPVGSGPPQATGMDVYIGTSSGGETYQGQTTSTTAQYTQAVPLTTGAAVPNRNATPCRVFANDAIWPTGTGYQVSLVDSSGNTLFQYPQMWQVLGPGSTYNLSQGIPYYNGQVTYPVPILSQPTNHNPQSISGPLIMGQPGGAMYSITNVSQLGVGTALPGWGIDVEGSGLNGLVNSVDGYLVNGAAGTSGQCLASDGTAFDRAQNCITALPTFYYQTVASAGTAKTQRPTLNFNAYFTLTDSSSPAETTVAPVTTGSEAKLATAAAAGTNGHCVQWDASGGISDAGASCVTTAATDEYFSFTGCSVAASTDAQCTGTATLGSAMPDTSYTLTTAVNNLGGGQNIFLTVNGSLTTTTFPYALTCTFDCTSVVTPTVYVHAHHN
jgi:hypothetical protein